MQKNLFIPIVLGTNREGRQSEQVANLLFQVLQKRDGITTKLFDVRDFVFPQNNYGQATKDQFPKWKDAVIKADGLVLVVPEYNNGYPGSLKFLLDTLLPEYNHKAVGLVGVSARPWGGSSVIDSLLPVVQELGLVVASVNLKFPKVQDLFDTEKKLQDKAYEEHITRFFNELEWLAQSLQWGRKNMLS
jgi:NAD(P)H-dependent FMN reductase